MNAQAITEKIIEEARAAAADVLREASEKIDRIHAEAEREAERTREAAAELADAQAAQLRDRMLRMAELDQKKALLKVKREVIDEAFGDALARMHKMDADQKKDFFERLLLAASEQGEQLVVGRADRALFDEAYMTRLNAALRKAGKPPVELSDEVGDGGGFVLRRGGLAVSCTFESVLDEQRPRLEAEVAAALFGAS
ncbi:MAG: V-type ATP synthase subunit E family protein [Christensenellaceae bacterium]|nr:V-type ATP synthase subunit E family protein [Christensenellaceae bacterium]